MVMNIGQRPTFEDAGELPGAYQPSCAPHAAAVHVPWLLRARQQAPARASFVAVAEPETTVEVHVLHDYSRDFYGLPLRVVALGYLRPEMKFSGIQQLLGRIRTDIGVARSQLQSFAPWQQYKNEL